MLHMTGTCQSQEGREHRTTNCTRSHERAWPRLPFSPIEPYKSFLCCCLSCAFVLGSCRRGAMTWRNSTMRNGKVASSAQISVFCWATFGDLDAPWCNPPPSAFDDSCPINCTVPTLFDVPAAARRRPVHRNEMAADRAVSRRPGDRSCRSWGRSEHLLLWHAWRWNLEDHRWGPSLASYLRQRASPVHWSASRRAFRFPHHLRWHWRADPGQGNLSLIGQRRDVDQHRLAGRALHPGDHR